MMMCQVSPDGCDQGKQLPNGHVGAVVRDLAEPYVRPESARTRTLALLFPGSLSWWVEYLDRALLVAD